MSDKVFKELLRKRKDRAIATILGFKDEECNLFLPDNVSDELRKVILDQINDFYDMCLDAMKSMDSVEVVFNEEYARKLDEIHEAVNG